MKLRALSVENCRNIAKAEFEADEALTVITGQNAQGKTSLLECIWLLTGSKSFRGAKDIELVKEKELFGRVVGDTLADGRDMRIEITIAGEDSGKRGRSAKVNGVPYGRATDIAGRFTAVVFDPGHLSLVKGGPEGRRRFMDAALCQLYPGYITTLRRYTRAVSQKNALLKQYRETPDAPSLLEAFDAEMAAAGEEITRRRRDYLGLLGPLAESLYSEISSGKETLTLSFLPTCEEGGLLQELRDSRAADIRAGFCTTGPHREDFETAIDGRSARSFGSQGQQRSVAIGLKLAEAATAKEVTGEHPVMLLDDVLSELDETRQMYLLSRINDRQSFVTTCDASAFSRVAGRVITLQAGALV